MIGKYKITEKNNTKTIHIGKHPSVGAIMFDNQYRLMSAVYWHTHVSDFVTDISFTDRYAYAAKVGQEITIIGGDMDKLISTFESCEGIDFLDSLNNCGLSYVAEKLTELDC